MCVSGGDGLSRMGSSGSSRSVPGRSMGYKLNFGRSRITDDDELVINIIITTIKTLDTYNIIILIKEKTKEKNSCFRAHLLTL